MHLILIDVVLPGLLALLATALGRTGRCVRTEASLGWSARGARRSRTARGPASPGGTTATRRAAPSGRTAGTRSARTGWTPRPAELSRTGGTWSTASRRTAAVALRPIPVRTARRTEHGSRPRGGTGYPRRNEGPPRRRIRIERLYRDRWKPRRDGWQRRRNRSGRGRGRRRLFGFRLGRGFLGRRRGQLFEQSLGPLSQRGHRSWREFDPLEQDRLLEIEGRGVVRGLLSVGLRLRLGNIGRRATPFGRLQLDRDRRLGWGSLRGRLGRAPLRLLGFFRGLLPLLPFPPEAHGGHLRVVERLQRAASDDMHVFEQCHQLLGRNPKFAG